MNVYKCKMCGGNLDVQTGSALCKCAYCGTSQTIPAAGNERKTDLFNEANRLRIESEFDQAAAVYAAVADEFPYEAEAYWGRCLCRYGIEYVDEPQTGRKIPTCHRTLAASILEDGDYLQALRYAHTAARAYYTQEAGRIDAIQRGIFRIVENEAPYDVFICYKETDESGRRTEDSVLAHDIYDALTSQGLKVFFARVTLEDKLGQEYEPYIYAALQSARVMLAVFTSAARLNAAWVKNEWSRYLEMMETDRTKYLVPCYKGIGIPEMPPEFRRLQGQDMSKLGWLQDLTRGVMKLCGKDQRRPQAQDVSTEDRRIAPPAPSPAGQPAAIPASGSPETPKSKSTFGRTLATILHILSVGFTLLMTVSFSLYNNTLLMINMAAALAAIPFICKRDKKKSVKRILLDVFLCFIAVMVISVNSSTADTSIGLTASYTFIVLNILF